MDWDKIEHGIRSGGYNLLLGAGVSLDSFSSPNSHSYRNKKLPGAGTLTEDILALKPGVKKSSSLQRIFRTLNDAEIQDHITERFRETVPGETVKLITNFRWKRIFTLNIDDALENAYHSNDASPQKPVIVNYRDPFSEFPNKFDVPVIHLHGLATRPKDGYIFDINTYMKSVSDNNIWCHILGNIIRSEPFIVMGASLDEPDITYFISERDDKSVRIDRPPSILVEPFPDDATEVDCNDFELNLAESTAEIFLKKLDDKFPNRANISDNIVVNFGDIVDAVWNDKRCADKGLHPRWADLFYLALTSSSHSFSFLFNCRHRVYAV